MKDISAESTTEQIGGMSVTKRVEYHRPISPVLAVAALVLCALAFVLGMSIPCDHEFWGGIKVGVGAVCR